MITTFNQEGLKDWICDRLRMTPTAHFQSIGSVSVEGILLGVVGFDNYNGSSCNLHIAGDEGFLTKNFVKAVFDYGFNELGCNVIICTVDGSNEKSLNLVKRFDFKEIAMIPDASRFGNMHIFTLHRKDCKWIKD